MNENPLLMAQAQVKAACDKLDMPPAVYELLKTPQRVLEVSIPVRMDDGTVRVFTGYRSQHNDAVGPTKGGIRFHPGVTRDEVMALSVWMTFKCSVTGIPYGGGKGGITVDPSTLSAGELERLSRGYMQGVYKLLGEKVDIPAPDVNTNGQIMAWMTDEYNKLVGHSAVGVLTGKPLAWGGSKGREAATGLGVFITMREAFTQLGIPMQGAKVAVQGLGNVGSFAAQFAAEAGANVVAIAEWDCTLYDENGLDIPALLAYKAQHGTLKGAAKEIPVADFWALELDALIPAALEHAIDADIARRINAKIVPEAANGPCTSEADQILNERGVFVIPDILCNAGGVTVSYFEWVQNLQGYYWTAEEVHQKAERAMVEAYNAIAETQKTYNVPMRTAAYMHSIKRIAEVMKLRGWY